VDAFISGLTEPDSQGEWPTPATLPDRNTADHRDECIQSAPVGDFNSLFCENPRGFVRSRFIITMSSRINLQQTDRVA